MDLRRRSGHKEIVLPPGGTTASVAPAKPPSGRVMQKIGMKYEGCSPQQVRHRGRFEDLERYGLLRADFEASR